MTDKHLANRAKLILRELHMRQATFLHAWMAEYIAECLETLEKEPTDTPVKDRCAATIARLWLAYVEDRRQSLAHAGEVYWVRARLTDDVLAELRAELSDKADVRVRHSLDSAVRLRHLTALEEQVLELYGASAALREGRPKMATTAEVATRDMKKLLAELRKETETIAQRIVTAVFPDFANIDLEDVDAIGGAAVAALRTIDRARQRRLGTDRSPTPSRAATTKRRSSKKSIRKTRPSRGEEKK